MKMAAVQHIKILRACGSSNVVTVHCMHGIMLCEPHQAEAAQGVANNPDSPCRQTPPPMSQNMQDRVVSIKLCLLGKGPNHNTQHSMCTVCTLKHAY